MREKGLPAPPKSSTFVDVLPYIIKLALAERQLWGRLVAAFCCLLVSKAAGAWWKSLGPVVGAMKVGILRVEGLKEREQERWI